MEAHQNVVMVFGVLLEFKVGGPVTPIFCHKSVVGGAPAMSVVAHMICASLIESLKEGQKQ